MCNDEESFPMTILLYLVWYISIFLQDKRRGLLIFVDEMYNPICFSYLTLFMKTFVYLRSRRGYKMRYEIAVRIYESACKYPAKRQMFASAFMTDFLRDVFCSLKRRSTSKRTSAPAMLLDFLLYGGLEHVP
jgi:hypothetical protein